MTCKQVHTNEAIIRDTTQHGFTIVELLIVLVIGGVLVFLGLSKYDTIMSSSNVTEEISNITTIAGATKSLKSTQGYGVSGTSLVTTLEKSGGLPKNVSVAAGSIANVYGGTIDIKSTGAGYEITETNVPQADCIKLSTKLSKSGFYSTQINTSAARVGEVSATDATTDCSSATANSIKVVSAS